MFDGLQSLKHVTHGAGNTWPPDDELGKYMRIYRGFRKNATKVLNKKYNFAIYIGKTIFFVARDNAHNRGTGGNHYEISGQATDGKMIPLLFCNSNVPYFIEIGELTLICLFLSWYP